MCTKLHIRSCEGNNYLTIKIIRNYIKFISEMNEFKLLDTHGTRVHSSVLKILYYLIKLLQKYVVYFIQIGKVYKYF